jgi:hypothetical protein
MTEFEELGESLLAIHHKLDRVVELLEGLQARSVKTARPAKLKRSPLTQEDVTALQTQFAALFERWIGGQELETQDELERLDAEDLRRLADANNLNVTSKMSKQKVLHLIGARFREKKQLHRVTGPRENHGA